VTVVAVTDGEAAYPTVHPSTLADRRRVEQHRALALLGVDPAAVVRLGLPDGGVVSHEDELTAALRVIVAEAGLVVAPWIGDHHSDHEACGRAAVAAARSTSCEVRHGLFWGWSFGSPTSPSFTAMTHLELTPTERRTRLRALTCHRSQVTAELAAPMLGAADLEPLVWPAEYYISADAG
jgi:LmbE family N-acetylglucosaminyl deacetylase